jgi:hypothetical protein
MGKSDYGRTVLFFVFTFFAGLTVFGQKATYEARENFLEAESYFLYEEYLDALPLYAKLKEKYPENYYLDYKIGRCYLNIPYERSKSVFYLERASSHISSKFIKESDWNQTEAPLDVLYFLGDAYRINNKLDKAQEAYLEFKRKAPENTYDIELVQHQLSSLIIAKQAMANFVDIDEINVGDVINSRFSETNPVVSEDESTLVFAARLAFYQGIFYSKKEKGQWTAPVNMLSELGIDGDCYPTSISPDGKELYVYRSNEFQGDIFVTNFKNGKWSKLRKLNSNINTKYWESHAFISHDGKTLYFTSNRPGGSGELDIYQSKRTSGDNWGEPVNLGSTVNSRYNDDTPFLLSDEKTLYFSSLGHETMGGYDIFVSTLSGENQWTKPVNIGYPINTTDDDMFFCPVNNGLAGYTAKYDPNGYGRYDLYRFEIYSDKRPRIYVNHTKIDKNGQAPSSLNPVYVAVYSKSKKDTILRQRLTQSDFNFDVPYGDYTLVVKAAGYKPENVGVNIPKGDKDVKRNINIKLTPDEKPNIPSSLLSMNEKGKDSHIGKQSNSPKNNYSKRANGKDAYSEKNIAGDAGQTLPKEDNSKDLKTKGTGTSSHQSEINTNTVVPLYMRPGYYLLIRVIHMFH